MLTSSVAKKALVAVLMVTSLVAVEAIQLRDARQSEELQALQQERLGDTGVCPEHGNNVYEFFQMGCRPYNSCLKSFCGCIGGWFDFAADMCFGYYNVTSCGVLNHCTRDAITCFNAAAEALLFTNTIRKNNKCAGFPGPVHQALLEAAAERYFINTTYDKSCRSQACTWANKTRCPVNYEEVCVAPPQFYGRMQLSGSWKVVRDRMGDEAILNALQRDMKTTVAKDAATTLLGDEDESAANTLTVFFSIGKYTHATELQIRAAAEVPASSWLSETLMVYVAGGGSGVPQIQYLGSLLTAPPKADNAPFEVPGKCKLKCVLACIIGGILVVAVIVVVTVRSRREQPQEAIPIINTPPPSLSEQQFRKQ